MTAVEFALIAAPFFLLLMGILETVLVYFANAVLEKGLQQVSRKIRTGEVQTQNLTAAAFKNLLCAEVSPLLKCDANLAIDVRTSANFGSVQFSDPLDGNGEMRTDYQFDPGHSGDIVLARAFYKWGIATPLISETLSNMAGDNRLLSASFAFRNEPY